MKRKKRIPDDEKRILNKAQNLINAVQLPLGVLLNNTHFEVNDNREVIVDGCKGIIEYNENIVKINTGKMIVSFSGRNLTIKCLTVDSLIIQGFITSIEFIT